MSQSIGLNMKVSRPIGFFFLLTLSFAFFSHAQSPLTPVFHFELLTEQHGLSNNGIRSNVVRDKQGYVWIGTVAGVDRYDGYQFKHYQPIANDPRSLGSANPFAILSDSRRRLWISTNKGSLSLYVPERDNFCSIPLVGPDSISVRNEWVTALYEDRAHAIWVGTTDGIYRTTLLKGAEDAPPDSLSKYMMWRRYPNKYPKEGAILETPDGDLMVGTRDGLYVFNRTLDHFDRLRFQSRDASALNDTVFVTGLALDQQGNLWVATVGAGLFRFDERRDMVQHFQHKSRDPLTISHNSVLSVHVDSRGMVWVGTESGTNLFDPKTGRCIPYLTDHGTPSDHTIYSICSDSTGAVWIGTLNDGLYRLSPRSSRLPHYSLQDSNGVQPPFGCSGVLDDSTVWVSTYDGVLLVNPYNRLMVAPTIKYSGEGHGGPMSRSESFKDAWGNLWFTVEGRPGLFKFESRSTRIRNYTFDGRYLSISWANSIRGISGGPAGTLWLAAYNAGLMNFDPQTGAFIQRKNIRSSNLFKDQVGKLWIGSDGSGLTVYDPQADSAEHFANDVNNPLSISHDWITRVYEDAKGRVWVGTRNGLNSFDRATKSFSHVDSSRPNHNWDVNIIADDGKGGLWVSYNRRVLSHIDPTTNTCIDYDTSDGVCGTFLSSFVRLKDGKMMISGDRGMNIFHPDSLSYPAPAPPIVITRMSVNDEPVVAPLLDMHEGQVVLPYNHNVVELEFAALEYDAPRQVEYSYRLEGLEDEWVRPMGRRFVRYAGLSPGEYTFHVKAIQTRGLWTPREASLAIAIMPPWWRSSWAYATYVFLLLGSLYMSYRVSLRQVKLKQRAEIEHFRAEHLAEVDRVKSHFFANISHEFRTPLMLILGPIQKWRDLISPDIHVGVERKQPNMRQGFQPLADTGELNRDLGMAERNAHRLLKLINQLLDLSKLDAGAMKLRACRINIAPLIKGMAYSFESSAGMRGIALNVITEREEIEVYCDKDMLEKILTNLLSNAFRFTPEGGGVVVSIAFRRDVQLSERTTSWNVPRGDGCVEISVSDTGIGIPQDQLDKVFDRFYQVDASQTREHEGSGIGLALVKELVELHHGTIQVQSEVGRGTTFTVRLPLGRSHLKGDEIVEVPVNVEPALRELDIVATDKLDEGANEQAESGTVKGEKSIVLVVEDNADVRIYIKDYLVPAYQVEEARDGAEGIEKAQEIIPDLIISDVMMPRKDGYEVCRTLKLDEKTSHIPIILLTAKAASENKIEGLEIGADDYLIKPFEPKELLARVKNLIDLRRKLRERFKASAPLKPGEIAVTSMDDAFLSKVKAAVEQRMGDEHFHIVGLSAQVGMSRVQLHRKLTSLTDQSPGEFIRYIRLHRAMELLQKDAGTVSEIAYTVGFSDPSYFSKCFHKQFGKAPTDVKRAPAAKSENSRKTTQNSS